MTVGSHGASAAIRSSTARETPLHIAARTGNAEILTFLLSISRDTCSPGTNSSAQTAYVAWVNRTNASGLSAIHISASMGHLACVQAFMALPEGWAVSQSELQRALYAAMMQSHQPLVSSFLIKSGIPIPEVAIPHLKWPASYHRKMQMQVMPRLLRSRIEDSQSLRCVAHRACMRSLINSPQFSDVCFLIEGREFCAHRCVMSAQSEYFRALLYGGLAESRGDEPVTLHDVSWSLFEVSSYCYIFFLLHLLCRQFPFYSPNSNSIGDL